MGFEKIYNSARAVVHCSPQRALILASRATPCCSPQWAVSHLASNA